MATPYLSRLRLSAAQVERLLELRRAERELSLDFTRHFIARFPSPLRPPRPAAALPRAPVHKVRAKRLALEMMNAESHRNLRPAIIEEVAIQSAQRPDRTRRKHALARLREALQRRVPPQRRMADLCYRDACMQVFWDVLPATGFNGIDSDQRYARSLRLAFFSYIGCMGNLFSSTLVTVTLHALERVFERLPTSSAFEVWQECNDLAEAAIRFEPVFFIAPPGAEFIVPTTNGAFIVTRDTKHVLEYLARPTAAVTWYSTNEFGGPRSSKRRHIQLARERGAIVLQDHDLHPLIEAPCGQDDWALAVDRDLPFTPEQFNALVERAYEGHPKGRGVPPKLVACHDEMSLRALSSQHRNPRVAGVNIVRQAACAPAPRRPRLIYPPAAPVSP